MSAKYFSVSKMSYCLGHRTFLSFYINPSMPVTLPTVLW